MIVVSDTSPLLYLSRVGQLDLLAQLYTEVVVPRTVWAELTEARPDAPGVAAVLAVTWIRIEADVQPPPEAQIILADVDAGEASAIALALATHADLLLIDDAAGRRAAEELGVAVRGTLGVLVTAKARGVLPEIAPLLARLLAEGFRASDAVVDQALRAAGERRA